MGERVIRRCGTAIGRMAGTEGVLLAIGIIMMLITLTTMTNSQLTQLPLRSLIVPAGTIAGALGFVGWFYAKKDIRAWCGGSLFVYSQVRSIAQGVAIANRTDGAWGWFQDSTAVWVWQLPALLGFVVWMRAHHEPNRGRSG